MRPNRLYIVVPCYNEEEVLPETARRLKEKLTALINAEKIAPDSRVLFVNDGDYRGGVGRKIHALMVDVGQVRGGDANVDDEKTLGDLHRGAALDAQIIREGGKADGAEQKHKGVF